MGSVSESMLRDVTVLEDVTEEEGEEGMEDGMERERSGMSSC